MGKGKTIRILCLGLAAVMILGGCLTGCAEKPVTNSQTAEPVKADVIPEIPAAVFSVDADYVPVPEEGAEIAQTLKLTSSEEISGTVTSADITLGGAFENMKVSDVSNDTGRITLTVSGVPRLEEASTLGDSGEIRIAGKFFGSDQDVSAGVPVQCMSGGEIESSYFYPFFDTVIENEASKELHIVLHPYGGSFTEEFGPDKITLEGVLEGAEIISINRTEEGDELVLDVSADLDVNSEEGTFGTITLAAGSLSNNAEEVSYTRDYSVDTVGRALSKEDLERIKETVHPKKNTPEMLDFSDIGTIFSYGQTACGYYESGMSAYKSITTMLGAFGLIGVGPSVDERRHQEIMNALGEISGQVEAMQADVTAVRAYAADNKRALENLALITTEDYLAGFHAHYDAMIKYTNEIENALMKNRNKILSLAEEYYDEDEEEREMSDYEINEVIEEFGWKICDMRQSNYYTIGQKMQMLEAEYTTSIVYLRNNNANPISRYCQLYQYTDNFSTISLVDKELYALDLDCQFDRTLSYLMLLGGRDSQQENAALFWNAYFPDVVAEATNYNGDPYCYLMRSFVQIAGDAASAIYKPAKNVTILAAEDAQEFSRRRYGRTLKEELILAGFYPDVFLNLQTDFNSYDFGSGLGCTRNDGYWGIAFSYYRVNGNHPRIQVVGWYDRMDGIFNYMKDDRNSYTMDCHGLYYDDNMNFAHNQLYDTACAGYISKAGTHYGKGWYVIEPMTYFKRV